MIKAGTTYWQNQNRLVTPILLLTYWCYPQGEKSEFVERICKKSLYNFLLSVLVFNTMYKLFNLLIPVLEWEFGNSTFFSLKEKGNKLFLQASMYLCIFIFYSDSLPVICEGFWLAAKLRASVNCYNYLFLYVFSSVFIVEMK